MDKPQPKWELVIRVAGGELHIAPATEDAAGWVRHEASAFGDLDDTLYERFGYYNLRLRFVYDALEVAMYLAGGSDNAQVTVRGEQIFPSAAPTQAQEA